MTGSPTRSFARFVPPTAEAHVLPRVPPKTTFGGAQSAERRRITCFMEEISAVLESGRLASNSRLGMALTGGLPQEADLLRHHDLDNFLQPLAIWMASPALCFAAATKSYGDLSTLRIGDVAPASETAPGWHTARGRCEGKSANGQRTLGRQIAAQAEPLPWGPVELDLALRVGGDRNWVAAWKPVIDALVAVLGRRDGAREFDIEDGRVTKLALHREIDPRLGHEIEVEARWRLIEPHASGPALTYQPSVSDASSLPSSAPTMRRIVRSGVAHAFEAIATLDRLREIQKAGEGFVVITDTANPPRLHRAGCEGIHERYFRHQGHREPRAERRLSLRRRRR
jgi:hypothetical protein